MYRITSPVVLGGSTWNSANAINVYAEQQREMINNDIEMFLKSGGKIQRIANGVSANPLTESQKSMARRKKK